MSVRTMARVWEHSTHAGSDLLMLLAIADFSDDDGRAYPAVPTLASKCRMTPRNANRVLAALQKSGELEVRQNLGPKGANLYQVMPMGMTATSPLTPASPRRARPAPLTPASSTPDAGVPKPLTPASDEPSGNHQGTTKEPSRRARTRKTAMPDSFAISERVQAWAAEKGYTRLDEHLEAFKGKAMAKGYVYIDWDEAFMNAIRADWANLRRSPAGQGKPTRSRHSGFNDFNYDEGPADGSLA